MASANETLVRRAIEAIWNRGDLDVADELFAPGFVNHNGLITDLVFGPEAIKISAAFYRLAFPDLHVTVEALTIERRHRRALLDGSEIIRRRSRRWRLHCKSEADDRNHAQPIG